MVERRAAKTERTPKRRGKQGVTRKRLIESTIDLMRAEGFSALTTKRIAKHAGIAQPGFYAHFKAIDDCVHEAVAHMTGLLRDRQAVARKRAFARLQNAQEDDLFAAVRATYSDTIEVMLEEPRFAEILLRYRRDTSLLGTYARKVIDEVREDMIADLWSLQRNAGAGPEAYPYVAFWVEEALALYFVGTEVLLDKRFTDKEMVFDTLAFHTLAMMQASAQVRARAE